MEVSEILGNAEDWYRLPGAPEEQIAILIESAPVELPEELLILLRYSNGGEGELPSAEMAFVLDPVEEIVRSLQGSFERSEFPGLLFFGGDGGGVRFALDIRDKLPWPVVAVDPIAGRESAEIVASSITEFLKSVGRAVDEKHA